MKKALRVSRVPPNSSQANAGKRGMRSGFNEAIDQVHRPGRVLSVAPTSSESGGRAI